MQKIRVTGKGLDGEIIEAQVRKHHNGLHAGIVVLTDRLERFKPETNPFLSDTFGSAMNQNIAFSGTPEIIHNGGTSVEWTGSAIQGTWNFADGGKVSLTSADTNDEASFAEETPTTIAMSGFTALTGKINLTIYNSVTNSLIIAFDLAGVLIGNSVNLNDYINTGLIGTEQSFVVPKADLGLTSQSVDGFTIVLSRTGGTKPTMTFDDIQLEQTGTPAVFKSSTPIGTLYRVEGIRVSLSDNVTGITAVAGATENATLQNLSYDQILGVSTLTNGISFQVIQEGNISISFIFKQLSDFLAAGFNIVNLISDGTNTCLTLEVTFNEPIELEGNGEDNLLSFTINDDLSGLLMFTANARGATEL